jgi:murein L,D-transpeptidase YcbB/YkuD
MRAITARLVAASDLDQAGAGEANAVAAALKRFQKRHGLTESGKANKPTLAALNVPLDRRVRQIEINMERWRWLPRNLGPRYILVNVPAFELLAVEQGAVKLRMPVVVGKEYNPTPIFSDTMTHIVLSPYWNIPQSIVRKEIVPAVQRDPLYLIRNEIEVLPAGGNTPLDPTTIDWAEVDAAEFPYQLRQLPGEDNSLGRIKFMLPNEFDIYLHDTPADHLFNRKKRDFSHGCIRVSRPFELAEWTIGGNPQWTVASLREAASLDTEQSIPLPQPLPVYILYLTAWVEDDGSVSFRDDLYDQDRQLLGRLQPPSDPEKARAACRSLLEKARR